MKKTLVILFLLLVSIVSCDKLPIEKPEKLIKEKQMIEMLIDIHMAESTHSHMRYDSLMKKVTATDLYYSVLDKYQVPDSVFEKSLIFYASTPKKFEGMYREVMNKLSEIEQDYSGRKNELLEFDIEE